MTGRSGRYSVIVVDNDDFVLSGVRAAVEARPETLTYLGGVRAIDDLDTDSDPPDVVLLDLYLGRDDTRSTPAIAGLVSWGTAVLLYTSCEFPVPLREAVTAGAGGLYLKNDGPEGLVEAIQAVAEGEFACSSALAEALLHDEDVVAQLTPRQIETVQGIADGLTRRQLARRMNVEESTVKENLKAVRLRYLDLGREVTNAHAIVREARRDGWVE